MTKKQDKLPTALDLAKEHLNKIERKYKGLMYSSSSETILMLPSFLPLLLINELYEIARLLLTKKAKEEEQC